MLVLDWSQVVDLESVKESIGEAGLILYSNNCLRSSGSESNCFISCLAR